MRSATTTTIATAAIETTTIKKEKGKKMEIIVNTKYINCINYKLIIRCLSLQNKSIKNTIRKQLWIVLKCA